MIKAKSPKFAQILGVNISITPRQSLLNQIQNSIQLGKKIFIVTPNPEIIVASKKDNALLEILNSADISLPDGSGVVFAAKLLGIALNSRIPGRKFMISLLDLARKDDLSVYFLGGDKAVIAGCINIAKAKYGIKSANGLVGPILDQGGVPVNKKQKELNADCIKDINTKKPDILFIGFGAPKQEKWFYLNGGQLKVKAAMVVGGSLDVLSGIKKSPPRIFEVLYGEWLWRVIQEPSRILRIWNALIVFPLIVLRERVATVLYK